MFSLSLPYYRNIIQKKTNNEKLRGGEEKEGKGRRNREREREIPKRNDSFIFVNGGEEERLRDRRGMGKIRDSQVFPVSVSSIDGKSSGFS